MKCAAIIAHELQHALGAATRRRGMLSQMYGRYGRRGLRENACGSHEAVATGRLVCRN